MARKRTPKPRSKSAAKKPARAGKRSRGRPGDLARARSEQRENSGVRGRPFQKGQSGNPGGRPKESDEVRELARAHTERAIQRLAEWMESTNAKASVAACTALLDRGWGKAPQAITGKDGGPLDVNINEVRGAIASKLDRIAAAVEAASVPR